MANESRRYMLFACYEEQPYGGVSDFSGFYPSVESAKEAMNPRRKWAQIAIMSPANFPVRTLYRLWEYRNGEWRQADHSSIVLQLLDGLTPNVDENPP